MLPTPSMTRTTQPASQAHPSRYVGWPPAAIIGSWSLTGGLVEPAIGLVVNENGHVSLSDRRHLASINRLLAL